MTDVWTWLQVQPLVLKFQVSASKGAPVGSTTHKDWKVGPSDQGSSGSTSSLWDTP